MWTVFNKQVLKILRDLFWGDNQLKIWKGRSV